MSSSANCKRQPAIVTTAAMSPLATMCADLLQLVAWRVLSRDLSDYVRFRAVCRHWRSSTDSPSGRGVIDSRFHPRRWMLLPDCHGLHPRDAGGKKRFFNLSRGAFICRRVPLLDDHRVLCTVEGLLLLQRRQHGDQDNTAICLLHPFTGDVAKFPPITGHTICLASAGYTSRGEGGHNLLPSTVTAASLSISADGGVATIVVMLSDMSRVLFATTKDTQWSFSAWSLYLTGITISSREKLYMLQKLKPDDGELRILQIDPPRHDTSMSGLSSLSFPAPKVIAVCPPGTISEPYGLVESCDSEIMLVGSKIDHVVFKRMLVYKLDDLILKRVVPLTSINGNALLIDIRSDNLRTSSSLSVSFKAMPIIMGDAVVCPDPTRDKSLELYHLDGGTWSSTAAGCDKEAAGGLGPCLCNLIHHIYASTCHCAGIR